MDSVARVQFWDLVEKMIKTKKMDLLKWRVCGRKQEDETFRNYSKRQSVNGYHPHRLFLEAKETTFPCDE